ncbi:hypothetical protein HQ531_02035 [bacterium]|nr:hypothetical protein [bacterium]
MGKDIADRVLIALEIGTEKFRNKHPLITRMFFRLFKKKIEKAKLQSELLDSKNFMDNKSYNFFLLQNKG